MVVIIVILAEVSRHVVSPLYCVLLSLLCSLAVLVPTALQYNSILPVERNSCEVFLTPILQIQDNLAKEPHVRVPFTDSESFAFVPFTNKKSWIHGALSIQNSLQNYLSLLYCRTANLFFEDNYHRHPEAGARSGPTHLRKRHMTLGRTP